MNKNIKKILRGAILAGNPLLTVALLKKGHGKKTIRIQSNEPAPKNISKKPPIWADISLRAINWKHFAQIRLKNKKGNKIVINICSHPEG